MLLIYKSFNKENLNFERRSSFWKTSWQLSKKFMKCKSKESDSRSTWTSTTNCWTTCEFAQTKSEFSKFATIWFQTRCSSLWTDRSTLARRSRERLCSSKFGTRDSAFEKTSWRTCSRGATRSSIRTRRAKGSASVSARRLLSRWAESCTLKAKCLEELASTSQLGRLRFCCETLKKRQETLLAKNARN